MPGPGAVTASGTDALVEQAWTLVEAGDGAQAQRLFQKVVELDPDNAEAWMMTGVLHAQDGANDQARACLDRALRIDPDYADPYLHLARLALGAGNAGAALEYAHKAVACDADYTEAWQFLAELSARTGDSAGAERAYRRLLALEPGRADIHNRLAAVLSARNRFDEALRACDEALRLDPANPAIFANRGNVHFRLGDMPAAIESFRRALELSPDFTGARLNLGNALREKGDLHEAADCYRRLLQDNPAFHEARLSLGECHLKTGEFEQALACYDTVLSAAPDHPVALLNKGFALSHLARLPEALGVLQRLVQVDARHADGWFNRGLVEKRLGLFEDALDSFHKTLSLSPDNPDIRMSLALLELSLGDYAQGWRHYVSRKSVRDRAPVDPRDLAGDLDGKRILLVKDQGIGDEIFFLRFARLLKDRGAWLGCRTDPKIRSIVARLPFLDLTVAESEQPPAAELIVSVGDLPYLLGLNDARAFPPPVALTVLPEARRRLEARLQAAGAGPLIGVTWWAGTPTATFTLADRLSYREVPFHLLAKILRPVDAQVVILQRAPDAAELAEFSQQLGRGVIDMSDLNDDLETMLALLDRLDDCVGVDNTNMHLRVGLGRQGRILVPHPPEWRMQMAGSSSPWFPGFSLYRQRADGDWADAIAQLEKDIVDSLSC
jgi:tetratricopeptide (TPR) repeat protein